jgi:hypothetical protein
LSSQVENHKPKVKSSSSKHVNRLKILGILFTVSGAGLFAYFVYDAGLNKILDGVGNIGFGGFAIILFIHFLRIFSRGAAWKLSVYEPYKLNLRDTIPAVIIGEAMSSMIPLGILISGTSKAVAVRNRVPFVVGLSSVATENLFYSLVTGLFIIFGGLAFMRSFQLAEGWIFTIDVLIAIIFALILLGILMVIRQWHFASAICEKIYDKGYGRKFLENGRLHVRLFENLIYGFYRQYPHRFLPIFLFQIAFHLLGIFEAWFILNRIGEVIPELYSAFLLESVSRLITVVFKLVPFLIGVDEAGAQFVAENLALAGGIGVTLAIIRKGKTLFWTAVGLILIIKRGFSLKQIAGSHRENREPGND